MFNLLKEKGLVSILKPQAIDLRIKERLFAVDIAARLGVREETCRKWLKPYPLTVEELHTRPRTTRNSLVGRRFGRLVAIERVHECRAGRRPQVLYKCQCDCGNQALLPYSNLMGNTRSCGCLRRDMLSSPRSKGGKRGDDTTVRLHAIGRYYRRNAKLAGRMWEIHEPLLLEITSRPCAYCGFNKGLVGLDRVDSLCGYTAKNVVPCCERCNRAKSDMTLPQFKTWVMAAYSYMSKSGQLEEILPSEYAPTDGQFMANMRSKRLITDRGRRQVGNIFIS